MTVELLMLGNAPLSRMVERVKLAEASGCHGVARR